MVRSSEVVPVGATPAGVFDIACRVAESGGSLPPEITEAARAVAGELGSFPPDEVRGALERIITSLHGAILVESAPGAGTTFDIFVPVAETGTSAPPASARAILTGTERVLVVDDDRLVLDSVVAMLSQLGYQVQAQTNAAAALAAFESDPQAFDLVLTDMTMPGMTGDVLAERLKRCRPDIPVILTSGFNDERNQGDAMVQAVDGYLAKPIFLETLSEVVRGTLRNAVADRRGPAIGYARA